jgi:hypothetical protein
VRFNRDVKPILAENCFACHGPDRGRRKGRLRLDRRADAVRAAVLPGDSGSSPLLARVTSDDPHEVMPPPRSNRARLSAAQVEVLRRWIDEGAKYEPHWAFVPPARPPVPAPKRGDWVRNPVDAFLAAGHEKQGLAPAPEAGPAKLLRRLSLDLTGLPPTPAEVAAFAGDRSPGAYGKAVERLLASPRFGERMAVFWLDLVRYADTDGYSMDNHREVWLYRDYVIDAFNRNTPFDRFTTQQLAGDLLPHDPGRPREHRKGLVASGYNRLLMTSQEGCADPREYVVRYAADRVKNLATAWLGVTLGCAECHDHKFDPFTARDFYSLAAFFADVQEKGVGPQQLTPLPSPEQAARLGRLEAALARRKAEAARPPAAPAPPAPPRPRREHSRRAAGALAAGVLLLVPAAALGLRTRRPAAAKRSFARQRSRLALFGMAAGLALLCTLLGGWPGAGEGRRAGTPFEDKQKALARAEAECAALRAAVPSCLVSSSGPPREVRVLPRGDWTNTSGPVVGPGTPAVLPPLETRNRKPPTRLDLARWLVAPQNPLVARVLVNRLWRIAFGVGLVPGGDDFGTLGAAPTHPELLDWLAVELVERGWDVKGLLQLLVTSAAYRQASTADPDNRWLAHQNRFRLDAEFVRDQALAVSGLLTERVGGRSVKPYQPDGYWAARFTEKEYQPSRGEDQYRRGVYTYWCRTYPHPSLQAFDAPPRQLGTAERGRSATPAQALVLLNDPTYGEAARALALRALLAAGPTASARLGFAYRLVLARDIRPPEEAILTGLLEKHRREYAADRPAAARLLRVGAARAPAGVDEAELAAWTSVARVLLNLQETITRE